MRFLPSSLLLAALILASSAAQARTKLVTLPERDRLVLSLENPNHALLFEEREIPLQRGTNFIDFSWSGVTLDESSVVIELLDNTDAAGPVNLIAAEFPSGSNSLTWQLFSPTARIQKIRVSYLLDGISQETNYELTVGAAETSGDFRQHLLLRNQSGEDLTGAQLIIPGLDPLDRSIQSGEARRLLSQRQRDLPIEKIYTSRPLFNNFVGESGETIDFVYTISHDDRSSLGAGPLPQGRIRVFAEDGIGSSIFLGEDMLPLTPPREQADIRLGTVRDTTLKRRLMETTQSNVRRSNQGGVVAFDATRIHRYELENFREEPVSIRIIEEIPALEWELSNLNDSRASAERQSISEFVFTVILPGTPPGEAPEKVTVDATLLFKNVFASEAHLVMGSQPKPITRWR